ncbi:DUF1501 domain-containing protein [Bryobacter aggregatus]|uniref:DUF1501 domain-containing protein n=1 Tax=Bryobacter aggregatus TaxID=360054 RepID=UPI00055FA93F|nr:DUF1501 domain-containing protein [Bryobacter aggregatus]
MASRRAFLRRSGIAMFGIGSSPLWLQRAMAVNSSKKILVAIFQRGAADGLNIVVPHGENAYYSGRPSIAIPKPGAAPASAVDLDGFFGLHPNLKALKPIFDEKKLAIVHACGSPDPTRSHFDAQDYMESGTPGLKATRDGWLNRAIPQVAGQSPIRAVSVGPVLARTLRGNNAAVALSSVRGFQVQDKKAGDDYMSRYAASVDTQLKGTGRETFEAIRLLDALRKTEYKPANGAVYPTGRLGPSLKQIAQMIRADAGLEVAFADIGGWDHHVNEVGATALDGPLAGLLREFGDSLAAFYQDLGPRMDDVVVVTMSEFGRTARENGNRGTDHGHANVMFTMGGAMQGGKVYGPWPGMEREQLYEERDLDVTTDFRDVLSTVVQRHLGQPSLSKIFPGYQPKSLLPIFG